jgi:cell division protein FtsB
MSIKDLEEEKLELEIKELKRHWIKNPQYLQILLPTILAIFSLLYAITSGLFSSKQELLELNKKQLETDITAFQKQKENLVSTNNSLKKEIAKYNDSLKNKNLILKKYENSFTTERNKILALNEEVAILKNTRNDYNTEISKLEKEYNKKKQTYLNEIESKYYKEIDNEKKINALTETNKRLNQTIVDLNYNVDIVKSNPLIPKGKVNEFNIWNLRKMIDYYDSKRGKNDKEIERLERESQKLEKELDSLNVKSKILKIK